MGYSALIITVLCSIAFIASSNATVIRVKGSTSHGRLDGTATLRYHMNLAGGHLRQVLCAWYDFRLREEVYFYREGEKGTFMGRLKGRAEDDFQGEQGDVFTITIHNLEHRDFGMYSCNFQTVSGYSYTAVSNIEMTDKVIEVSGMGAVVSPGETALLQYAMNVDWSHMERVWCFYSPKGTSGLKEIYWYHKTNTPKEGFLYGPLKGRAEIYNTRNKEAVFVIAIRATKKEDAGKYSCNFHAVGSYSTGIATLTVHKDTFHGLSTGVTVMVGVGVALLVLATLTLAVVACRKEQIKTYVATKWSKNGGDREALVDNAAPMPKKVCIIDVTDTTNLTKY